MDQRTKCLSYLGLFYNVLQQQHMSIAMIYDIFFHLQGVYDDESKLAWQDALRTIMNTKIHVILKTLLGFLKMAKGIFKYRNGVHMRVMNNNTK